MSKKLYAILSEILEISEDKINNDASVENTPTWDSFAGLMIVSEVERVFDVKFNINEVVEIKGVLDLKKYLAERNIDI
jgi:acyl carrier protein